MPMAMRMWSSTGRTSTPRAVSSAAQSRSKDGRTAEEASLRGVRTTGAAGGRRRWPTPLAGLDLGTVRCGWRPTHRRCAAGSTGWWSPRSRGRGTGRARPGRSRTPPRGLVTQCSKSAVSGLLGVTWRTVGSIVTRVVGDIDAGLDRLAGLRRIGIDEVAYKRGHRYLTVVVDHDTGRLVWAAPGREEKTLQRFFDELGEQRCARSPTCRPTLRSGSPTSSPNAAPTRCVAPTRSTS